MSRVPFDEIRKWGENIEFSDEPLKFDVASTIIDRRKFFNSHVVAIEEGRKQKDRRELTRHYYDRLEKFYLIVNKEK